MPGLRDGYPRQGDPLVNVDNADYQRAAFVVNNQDGTNTIPENNAEETEFGMHENLTYYRSCQRRTRNMGLYTADRRLAQNNARFTRQNPGGARHGFECAEGVQRIVRQDRLLASPPPPPSHAERDYYPYWQPTPWKDIAVLTSNVSWCDYYRAHSENVKPREYCVMSEQVRQGECGRCVGCDSSAHPHAGASTQMLQTALSQSSVGSAQATAGSGAPRVPMTSLRQSASCTTFHGQAFAAVATARG